MPPASRVTDVALGHGCFGPTQAISGSPNVITGGKPQLRVGDAIMSHGCPMVPPHPRSSAQGSSTVITNSRPSTRIGDKVSCGGALAQGEGTVLMGG